MVRFSRLQGYATYTVITNVVAIVFAMLSVAPIAYGQSYLPGRYEGGNYVPWTPPGMRGHAAGPQSYLEKAATKTIEQAAMGFMHRAWSLADLGYGAMQVQYYLQYGLILPNPPQSPVTRAFDARVKTEGFWTASAGNLIESVNPIEIGRGISSPLVDDIYALSFRDPFEGNVGHQMGGIGFDALVGMAPRGLPAPARMSRSGSALEVLPSRRIAAPRPAPGFESTTIICSPSSEVVSQFSTARPRVLFRGDHGLKPDVVYRDGIWSDPKGTHYDIEKHMVMRDKNGLSHEPSKFVSSSEKCEVARQFGKGKSQPGVSIMDREPPRMTKVWLIDPQFLKIEDVTGRAAQTMQRYGVNPYQETLIFDGVEGKYILGWREFKYGKPTKQHINPNSCLYRLYPDWVRELFPDIQ